MNIRDALQMVRDLRDEVQAILGEEHPYEGISGGAEWMHTLGFGYLGEEHPYGAAAHNPGRDGRPAQPQAGQDHDVPTGPSSDTTARTYSATAAPCRHCGQLALVGVGRCACELPQQEGQE